MLPTAESAWSMPSAKRPGAIGHDLGHERDADGELAADAQPGQEAIEGKVVRTPSKAHSGR